MSDGSFNDFAHRLCGDPWGVLNESLDAIKELTEGKTRTNLTIGQRLQGSDLRSRMEHALDVILPYQARGWTRLESYIESDDLLPLALAADAKGMDIRSYVVAAALDAAKREVSTEGADNERVVDEARVSLAGVRP